MYSELKTFRVLGQQILIIANSYSVIVDFFVSGLMTASISRGRLALRAMGGAHHLRTSS